MDSFEFARKFKQLCTPIHQSRTMKGELMEIFMETATSEATEVLVIGSGLMLFCKDSSQEDKLEVWNF